MTHAPHATAATDAAIPKYRPRLRIRIRRAIGRVVKPCISGVFRLGSRLAGAVGLDGYLARVVSRTNPFGLNVHPIDDFYSVMPVLSRLKQTRARWDKPSDMVGVHYDLDPMRANLERLVQAYGDEWAQRNYALDLRAGYGHGFTEIDAMLTYMQMRDLKPKRYIEVGSGLSTYYNSLAATRNRAQGHDVRMSCIDPFPFKKLSEVEGLDIIAKEVQDVDPAFFEQLDEGDVLFIDSTHTVKIDGDVPYLFLEVLPRLRKGVTVHIHDIPFPYNIPHPTDSYIFGRDWPWYFAEAMLLQSFLAFNDSFQTTMSVPMLRHHDEDFLRRAVPNYQRIVGGDDIFPACSFWMKRVQ